MHRYIAQSFAVWPHFNLCFAASARQVLVVAPHKLQGNQRYVFQLTATDAAGQSGWASVEVEVNAPPSNGWLQVRATPHHSCRPS